MDATEKAILREVLESLRTFVEQVTETAHGLSALVTTVIDLVPGAKEKYPATHEHLARAYSLPGRLDAIDAMLAKIDRLPDE